MSAISWSLAQSHDADLRPGDLFEIRDTETGQVVYRRLIDDSDVERGQFNVPAGVLEDGVMYGHRVKRQSDDGWSASSVFSLARPPEKSVTAMTLTEFLLARIAEDETPNRVRVRPEFANRVVYLSTGYDEGFQRMLDGKVMTDEEWAEITEPVPPTARVLAECEAKRRIVEMMARIVDEFALPAADRLIWPDVNRRERHHANEVLYALALPYADHPDYREEWRP